MPEPSQSSISIHQLANVDNAQALIPGIESVFFATSGTQTFDNDDARAAFRERWLGRFLVSDSEFVFVALEEQADQSAQAQKVVGYLVGAVDDPSQAQRFSDLEYFQILKTQIRTYPPQLHVNLLEQVRGHGHGGRLVEAFVTAARQQGAPGVHVITGERARNVAFYKRSGFAEVARADWNDHMIVMLGRRISADD